MAEEQILTILIVFALFLNVLGFVFFALSLKEDKTKPPITNGKDYDLSINNPYLQQDENLSRNAYQNIEDEYKKEYPPVAEKDEETYQFHYEPSAPLKPEKEIESFQEKIYEPEPIDAPEEETSPYQYQPVYEEKGTEDQEEETSPYQYQPNYMTEDELEPITSEEEVEEEPIRPEPFQLDLTQEVDYKEEIRPTDEDDFENQSKLEGDYQFKHAYTKEERYKYEYDDYKGFKPTTTDEIEEEFDYTIDIDKEHEKYYGSEPSISGTNRYELYLQKAENEEKEEDLLEKARKNPHTKEKTGRQMFQPVDFEHVPETPLDRKEREAEETIDIKQFEPKKYENAEAFQATNSTALEEIEDDDEVDRRIQYLMGKMHDPHQTKKKKNPLDEEF